MKVKEIGIKEVGKLYKCVKALSEYHNVASVNFKGSYPSRPYEATLESFGESLEAGESKIAAIEDAEEIAGFCKVDLHGEKGKLDYLVVLPAYRGNGYGAMLMDWAMEQFRQNKIRQVEVDCFAYFKDTKQTKCNRG